MRHEDRKESGGLMVSHEDRKESGDLMVSHEDYKESGGLMVSHEDRKTKSSRALMIKSLGATSRSVVKNEFPETIIEKILKTLFTVTMTVDRELVNQVSSQ